MTHLMQWNKIDLVDDAARFPHMALHHLIAGETGGLFRSPAYLVRALTGTPVHSVTVTTEPDMDGNTTTATVFWLTEAECVAMVNTFAEPAECAGIIAALADGFRRAAHAIQLKREKVAERAARPRTVSGAVNDAAERIAMPIPTLTRLTVARFGKMRDMTPDDAQTAIAWLDALTEKPSSKTPAPKPAE